MPLTRRDFLRSAALAGAALPLWRCRSAPIVGSAPAVTAKGPFEPTWASLAQYHAPDWFRDAKFGIWAHWGPQCQPERGDWYARRMYIQGDPISEYHRRVYGHPSRVGFMEIIRQWKAERWDPEALMSLYARSGAKYFVSMANHHDNFDNFDSTHHAWNSVRLGPRRDIVGTWAMVARGHGLRFGVSNHSAHAWHWYQPAYGYDPEGALAGVRYDAARLTVADGRGQWWEGLDPQELYTGPSMVMPDGLTSAKAAQEWHSAHDGRWIEEPPPGNPGFTRSWLLRCNDLVDRYQPDFLYFDDTGLPLGAAGLEAAAHFYNASLGWHGGRLEAVVTGKQLTPEQQGAIVEDVERGFSDTLRALPWHADTCIGDWHYDRELFTSHRYKSAETVLQRLVDTVSKNGNLLLSIPVRADGTIDEDEIGILEEIASWIAPNGEAIFGSRPWKIYGEGPTPVAGGMMAEDRTRPFTAEDVRFTTRAGTLYAIVLGRPTAPAVAIRALATSSPLAPGEIERVRTSGDGIELRFTRDATALRVVLPDRAIGQPLPVIAIDGRGLV